MLYSHYHNILSLAGILLPPYGHFEGFCQMRHVEECWTQCYCGGTINDEVVHTLTQLMMELYQYAKLNMYFEMSL